MLHNSEPANYCWILLCLFMGPRISLSSIVAEYRHWVCPVLVKKKKATADLFQLLACVNTMRGGRRWSGGVRARHRNGVFGFTNQESVCILWGFLQMGVKTGREDRQGNKGRLCEPCGRRGKVAGTGTEGGYCQTGEQYRWTWELKWEWEVRGKDLKPRCGCGERKVWNSQTGLDTWREETLLDCLLISPSRNKQNIRWAGNLAGICLHLTAAHKPQLQYTHTSCTYWLWVSATDMPLKKILGLVMPHCGVIWMLNVDKCMTLSGSVSEYNRRPRLVLSCSCRCPRRTQDNLS